MHRDSPQKLVHFHNHWLYFEVLHLDLVGFFGAYLFCLFIFLLGHGSLQWIHSHSFSMWLCPFWNSSTILYTLTSAFLFNFPIFFCALTLCCFGHAEIHFTCTHIQTSVLETILWSNSLSGFLSYCVYNYFLTSQ